MPPALLFGFTLLTNACGSDTATPAESRADTDAGTQHMNPGDGAAPGDAGTTDSGLADAGNVGTVFKTPPGRVNGMTACTPAPCMPETVAGMLRNPTTFRASDTFLYWNAWSAAGTTSTTQVVQRMPIGGSTVQTLTSPADIVGLTLDSNFAFFSVEDARAVGRVALAGGTIETAVSLNAVPGIDGSAGTPYGIVAYADRLYFSTLDHLVLRAGKDGTGVSVIAQTASTVIDLVVDDDSLYYRDSDTVFRLPHTGTTSTTLFTAETGSFINGLRLDDDYVYWTVAPPNTAAGKVQRIAKAGGTVETLATGLGQPAGLAIDTTDVYFIDPGVGTSAGSGTIQRVALPGGGTPTVLVKDLAIPLSVLVTATHVYWTNSGISRGGSTDGSVQRIAK